MNIEKNKAFANLQEGIRCKTVSYSDRSAIDFAEFDKLHAVLAKCFPKVHETCTVEKFENHALLYCWKGTSDAPGIAFMGHQDVVPDGDAENATWEGHDGFSGDMDETYIWGRGTLDMKGQLFAIFEAMEALMIEGFSPTQDIYIISGHNEETGTNLPDSGAVAISRALEERGVKLKFVIDEGGAFFDGNSFGIDKPIALVGLCEKGYMDVEISCKQAGGHASMPPAHSALGNVCRAVAAIEKQPCKATLNPVVAEMFDTLAPFMKPPLSTVIKNRKILGSFLLKQLVKSPTSAAMVRTTTAPTMASGSPAPNVLAQTATAVINCRIAPDDSCEGALNHIRSVVGNDVEVKALSALEPSAVSGSGEEFKFITSTIDRLFPEIAVTAPYIMTAGSDAKVFHNICNNVYRVGPFFSILKDFGRIHSAGERIEKESYIRGIELFYELMKNA